tara:strand:+ start:760 stop:972 length:213 start_codon:yes stop_codon:yes gene_type:complete
MKIYPSFANLIICEAFNLESSGFLNICIASILDRIRPVKTDKQRARKLLDALCEYKLLPTRPDRQELETS